MCPHAVREWLVLLTMEMYVDRFMNKGYNTIAHCKRIVPRDLKKLGIYHRCHRKLLLDGVQLMNNAPEERFKCSEPCEHHHHSPIQRGSDSSTDSSDSGSEAEECRSLPVFGPSNNVNPKESENVFDFSAEVSDVIPPINLSFSYTCAACPDLVFRSVTDVAEHIADADDENTHKIAPLPIGGVEKLPSSLKLENPMQ
ncbi:uncharacterized protein LOC111066387 [Drosophila obscura]|uniref:uncharacterized protein LOC111066387 n=1 Tax=Drosophila obscura TaxID=7282 RepID=UPI001BB28997|nr:uncharacterized protein LOC111066387 [Drosophila obscura]